MEHYELLDQQARPGVEPGTSVFHFERITARSLVGIQIIRISSEQNWAHSIIYLFFFLVNRRVKVSENKYKPRITLYVEQE